MVKLSDLLKQVKIDDDELIYINKDNDELIDLDKVNKESFYNDLSVNNDSYITVPKKGLFDMTKCIMDFINQQANENIKAELQSNYDIQRFMDKLYQFGLRDFWMDFIEMQYYNVLKSILEENGISYADDLNGNKEYVIMVKKTYIKRVTVYAKTKDEALTKVTDMDLNDELNISEDDLLEGVYEEVEGNK